jgi:hypothetical protein
LLLPNGMATLNICIRFVMATGEQGDYSQTLSCCVPDIRY